ncbi:MAG: radical SAM protein [Pirellulales bacterium]|nr:radical SAM protein [Pirellulales bacterium]
MSEHVFGPVPSRRLGRSLGVDLVPFKTCTYDCVYCQLGRTTCLTTQRKEWVPVDEVFDELAERLDTGSDYTGPDYVTLSGSGEPTLCTRIGELIDRIKRMTRVPVAVLTNGSLLWQEEVRRELAGADLVIPSLDAGSPEGFQRANRPHPDVTFERLIEGLIAFRETFSGQYWLEVFLMADASTDAEVERMAWWVERIRPDRVQLNTVTRPPAETDAVALSREELERLANRFQPAAEVIAEFHATQEKAVSPGSRQRVLTLLERRPCTLDDLAQGTGMHYNEIIKYIEYLSAQGQIQQTNVQGRTYYRAVR